MRIHGYHSNNDDGLTLGNSERSETNGPKFQNHPIST